MRSTTDYAKQVIKLRTRILETLGLAILELPDRLDPKSEFAKMGGSAFENWKLKALADSVDNVAGAFDDVQRALGLPIGYTPRFESIYDRNKPAPTIGAKKPKPEGKAK